MRITARTLLFMLTLPLVVAPSLANRNPAVRASLTVMCKGPREVYEITKQQDQLVFDGSQDGLDDDEKKPVAAGDKADDSGAVVDVPAVGSCHPTPSLSIATTSPHLSPWPFRADARILRVLFAAYEDEAQSLNMPGYAYVEVEPKRWLVGAAANKQPAKIIPLQMRQDADGNLGHKAKVNNPSTRWASRRSATLRAL